jgi:hypothetical protein
MLRGSIGVATVVAALLVADARAVEELPRIVDVRAGRHAAFDRIVIELDREAPVFELPSPTAETLFEVRAKPLLPRQEVPTGFDRLRRVVFEGLVEGTRIRVSSGGGEARAFLLRNPPRLVIDVAGVGLSPFEAPPGTTPVQSLPREIALPDEQEAAEPESPSVAVEPAPAPPGLEGVEEPAPAPAIEELISPPTPEEVVPSPEAPEPVPPAPEEAEAPVEVPSWVPLEPEPAPPVVQPPRLPLPPEEPGRVSPYGRWLALLVWVGGPLLVGGLVLYLTRRRGTVPEEAPEPRAPESITPEEVLTASDRLDLLEKRIDEEVRSRIHLDSRVVQVQEDLKVVRDRVGRLVRRGEGPS